MQTYGYDYNGTGGGLFYSNLSSNFAGLGNNCDRLSSVGVSRVPRGTYDIFSSFALPKLPLSGISTTNHHQDDIFLSDDEENTPKPRLPLFSRCPVTNRAQMEAPGGGFTTNSTAGGKMKSSLSLSPMKNLHITSPIKQRPSPVKIRNLDGGNNGHNGGLMSAGVTNNPVPVNSHSNGNSPRVPLLSIGNQCNRNLLNYPATMEDPAKISYSQVAKKPAETELVQPSRNSPSPTTSTSAPASNASSPVRHSQAGGSPMSFKSSGSNSSKQATVKPSLDDVKDDSLVAMTNKHGKGKYWFKSGCPTPDPRWPACQQLMIGPIPGDVEYSTLRSAFLSKGHTIHLFIQNNQAWLEKNQEKFGKKQVKFGYVVYTDNCVASRLLAAGHVLVGHVRVAVKQMDGQPAQFVN